MALTFWAFIVGDSHIPVQGDSNNTALSGFEFIAVQLHRKSVRQDDVMSDATNEVENIRGDIAGGYAYIHGSVDESPSGDLVRSLERPGAKTPRPYPRTETHHGSFTVNLDPSVSTHGLLPKKTTHQYFTRSPKDSKQTRE
jgi:hypothetical protein